jgi:hypothetical protein
MDEQENIFIGEAEPRKVRSILLTIDNATLDRYTEYYFTIHPKAQKKPIPRPYHESINTWMIMKRPAMNNLKQKWKDFIYWFINDQGYENLRIERCEIVQTIYYPTNRRHDIDNGVPKFLLDGFVNSQMIVDDDCKHITKLTMMCKIDADNPRTELLIDIFE